MKLNTSQLVLWVFVGLLVVGLVVGSLVKRFVGDVRPTITPVQPANSQQESIDTTNLTQIEELRVPAPYVITLFAEDIASPRDLDISPGNTLLVSSPPSGKVIALPDKDNDGKPDERQTVLENLESPHGLVFGDQQLIVAEETKVVAYDWDETSLSVSSPRDIVTLPKGGRHKTRSLALSSTGDLYISIGSTCDVCVEKNPWHGTVLKTSLNNPQEPEIFASGLRNAVFIMWDEETQQLWGTEMGRDFLGDTNPPDEINVINEGKHYGWPFCYGDRVYDAQFNQADSGFCQRTESPVFEITAHSAPLGLVVIDSAQFPEEWQGDLFVAYHGSWNSSEPVGYKVVRLDRDGETIQSEHDFITGFYDTPQTFGRPVDLVFDQEGDLYVSDDKGGKIYRVLNSQR